jgi:cytidylate kinase
VTSVAIDGPAGAGKSTVSKAVAARLGYRYVDTGAMYRAIALAAVERGIDQEDALAELARSVELSNAGGRLLMDGTDVTERIRESDVTAKVSQIAAHPRVRAALVQLQKDAATRENVVMEGRDIGTAVLPDAAVKVFLNASLEERARRRAAETGESPTHVMNAIAERDAADSRRAVSPLVRAPDAVEIDTTGRTIDDVVEEIVSLARAAERAGAKAAADE